MSTVPQDQQNENEDVLTQEPAKVILFNDDIHSFDEVISQLIKATRCTRASAEGLAWEVHTKGKAVVFGGELMRCMEVSHILEEIQLMTQIEVS
jgi:ATP-dependent Clp protease adaptor protein ClpS